MTLVVPYIGTWIETGSDSYPSVREVRRTLYRYVDWNDCCFYDFIVLIGRTLYRYVDWNRLIRQETCQELSSRTLYRYVDWNPDAYEYATLEEWSYLI